jgi:hypothetical protein
MGRHRFGEGQYRYLREPYPDAVDALKHALYPDCYRSPGTGGTSWVAKPRGRRRWRNGWTVAIVPVRRSRLRCCSSTGPEIGTPCIVTSTVSGSFRCKLWSTSTNPAPVTPAESSCSSSSVRAPNPAAPPPRCRKATGSCSPLASVPFARPVGGLPPQSVTVCQWCVRVSGTPSGLSSTMLPDGLLSGHRCRRM